MKKIKSVLFATISLSSLVLCSCGDTQTPGPELPKYERVKDDRNLSVFDYTTNNLSGVDALNRKISPVDKRNDNRKIGVFYHVWHGTHNTPTDSIDATYNITNLLENDPDTLWNGEINQKHFHYWGEPLYGYYNSSDPWVITRHMELLTNAGVDYLVYDLTNSVIYYDAINAIFEILDNFQKQGFNVPKVAFYTNTGSGKVINSCYNTWYKEGKYQNLWFSLDEEKPLIIGRAGEVLQQPNGQEIYDFFDIRESVWPSDSRKDYEGFPWMDWEYPQENYNGTMSVSLAQHPGMRMSEGSESNNGRGFDYSKFQNDSELTNAGANFEGQYEVVLKSNDKNDKNYDPEYEVNNVFITGFNEWIAQKLVDGADRVYFVDTFNQEYSRDIEMMRGGYGDNFYLQLMRNNHRYAFDESKHYEYQLKTMDINSFEASAWSDVKANYVDFKGDALGRDFISADQRHNLTDNSNRNDIVKTSVVHDENNLYIRVETKENITQRESTDKAFMNLLINTGLNEDNFGGYDFIVNRSSKENKCSIERLKSDFETENIGEADIKIEGKIMQVAIPLKTIGLNKDYCSLSLKVADNVQNQSDIMEYYISGDCAPIGRVGYHYGY